MRKPISSLPFLLLLAITACGGGNDAPIAATSAASDTPIAATSTASDTPIAATSTAKCFSGSPAAWPRLPDFDACCTNTGKAFSDADDQTRLARAASAVRTYHATLTVDLPTGVTERGTFEFVLPDRAYYTITMGANTNEMIVIGADRYARMSLGWMRLPPAPPGGGLPRVLTTTGGLDQLDGFRKAGGTGARSKGATDTVNGRPCQLYSHVVGANTFEYCVAENLPLRMKVTSTTAVITFLFTDFNQPLDISPPP